MLPRLSQLEGVAFGAFYLDVAKILRLDVEDFFSLRVRVGFNRLAFVEVDVGSQRDEYDGREEGRFGIHGYLLPHQTEIPVKRTIPGMNNKER